MKKYKISRVLIEEEYNAVVEAETDESARSEFHKLWKSGEIEPINVRFEEVEMEDLDNPVIEEVEEETDSDDEDDEDSDEDDEELEDDED
jgi:hypothetical protein